ncbi:MAG: sensor histidine kinase [Candidatus Binataceae bacterium]
MLRSPIKSGPRANTPQEFSPLESQFNALIAELSIRFVRVSLSDIDQEVNRSLQSIGLTLSLDRSTIALLRPDDGSAFFSHGWVRDERYQLVDKALNTDMLLPWTKARMLAGETVIMPSVDDLPEEAAIDKESFRRYGPMSNVMIPIRVGGAVVGAVGFGAMRHEREWPPRIVMQLQRMTQIIGYAFERKRALEELMRLRSELTYVARVNTMGQLAASMAHELNQPLAAILNNAEAIQGMFQSGRPDPEEVKAAIADIIEDDIRAGETIRRMRSLFRHDELKKAALDLSEVVSEVGRLVQSDALIHNVSFKLEARQRPVILADRIQLQQAIVNLVLNAFDAVAAVEDGPREVALKVESQESGWARVLIRDSGKGIPANLMPRIFTAFFTTKSSGLGMGLAISRSIIEAHGGRLSVSSVPGHGATFEIRLPSQPEAHA